MLGADNEYQKNYLSDLGSLYIVISKDKGIADFFDFGAINDKEWQEIFK